MICGDLRTNQRLLFGVTAEVQDISSSWFCIELSCLIHGIGIAIRALFFHIHPPSLTKSNLPKVYIIKLLCFTHM